MKYIKRLAIIGLVLVVIGLILGGIASATSNRTFYEVISSSNNVDTSNEFKDEKIDKIKIKFDVGSINIQESNNDYISYEYNGNSKIDFEEKLNDKELELSNKTHFVIGFSNTRSNLTVYLPKKNSLDLEISSDVSEVNISDIKVNNLDVQSDVGAVKLEDSTIDGNLKISSSVGSVNVTNIKEPKKVDIKSDVGSIAIFDLYSKKITLVSDVGSIKFINDDKSYKVTNFQVETSLGSKKIDIGE